MHPHTNIYTPTHSFVWPCAIRSQVFHILSIINFGSIPVLTCVLT